MEMFNSYVTNYRRVVDSVDTHIHWDIIEGRGSIYKPDHMISIQKWREKKKQSIARKFGASMDFLAAKQRANCTKI